MTTRTMIRCLVAMAAPVLFGGGASAASDPIPVESTSALAFESAISTAERSGGVSLEARSRTWAFSVLGSFTADAPGFLLFFR